MKKVERLRYIEQEWGPEWVLPYRACSTWAEIQDAILELGGEGTMPSLRTDWAAGAEQGLLLPFLHPIDPWPLVMLWRQYGPSLVYIVCEGVSPAQTRHNVVAQRQRGSLFLVEWDEGGCAQRDWERVRLPLQHAYVDRWGSWCQPHPGGVPAVIRARPPRALPHSLKLDQLYERLLITREEETVWTVRQDGRIVVW